VPRRRVLRPRLLAAVLRSNATLAFAAERQVVGQTEMNVLARSLRAVAKLRFRALGLATIKDLPTDRFNRLVHDLLTAGWRKAGEYEGFDAWIDYGRITMRRDGIRLTLEWDNWTEGSVEGPRSAIEKIAQEHKLSVTHEWRWAVYDEKR
jgi:hypothetical protein